MLICKRNPLDWRSKLVNWLYCRVNSVPRCWEKLDFHFKCWTYPPEVKTVRPKKTLAIPQDRKRSSSWPMIFQGKSVKLCNGVFPMVFLQHSPNALRKFQAWVQLKRMVESCCFVQKIGSDGRPQWLRGGRDIYDIYIYISYDITQNITKDDTKMILFWMQNIETQFLNGKEKNHTIWRFWRLDLLLQYGHPRLYMAIQRAAGQIAELRSQTHAEPLQTEVSLFRNKNLWNKNRSSLEYYWACHFFGKNIQP